MACRAAVTTAHTAHRCASCSSSAAASGWFCVQSGAGARAASGVQLRAPNRLALARSTSHPPPSHPASTSPPTRSARREASPAASTATRPQHAPARIHASQAGKHVQAGSPPAGSGEPPLTAACSRHTRPPARPPPARPSQAPHPLRLQARVEGFRRLLTKLAAQAPSSMCFPCSSQAPHPLHLQRQVEGFRGQLVQLAARERGGREGRAPAGARQQLAPQLGAHLRRGRGAAAILAGRGRDARCSARQSTQPPAHLCTGVPPPHLQEAPSQQAAAAPAAQRTSLPRPCGTGSSASSAKCSLGPTVSSSTPCTPPVPDTCRRSARATHVAMRYRMRCDA